MEKKYLGENSTPRLIDLMKKSINEKQDKINGSPGDLVTFDKNGKVISKSMDGFNEVVTSFNGRKGIVSPEAGDYTAEQVGAAPLNHNHNDDYYLKSEVDTKLDGKSNNEHNHDELYYTETEVDELLDDKYSKSKYVVIEQLYDSMSIGDSNIIFSNSKYCLLIGKNCETMGPLCNLINGFSCSSKSSYSHAEGCDCNIESEAIYSHAEGCMCVTKGIASHAGGSDTIASADYQTVFGSYNIESDDINDIFIIGGGFIGSRSNALRINLNEGTYIAGGVKAEGADFAEMFEYADGNPNNEDRIGRFVTLDDDKIRLANADDDFILGITSGAPTVVGDVYDDQWQGMYLYDIYGRPILEEVLVPEKTIEEPDPDNPDKTIKTIIQPEHTEIRQKINPNYNPNEKYIPRSKRPEWDAVGLVGKLVLLDDGTCQPSKWCSPSTDGIGTHSDTKTKFRVMKRLDENHVQILILPY